LIDATAALQAMIITAQVGSNDQLIILLVYDLKHIHVLRLAVLFYAAVQPVV